MDATVFVDAAVETAKARTTRIVDNNSFITLPPVATVPSYSIRKAPFVDGLIHAEARMMIKPRVLISVPIAQEAQSLAPFTTRLTGEQREALHRCAKGISLRFEAWAIVNALVNGGYAEKGVAGVITMTAKGKEYARMHTFKGCPYSGAECGRRP